jgi:hypothetical protein
MHLFIKRVIQINAIFIEGYQCYQLHKKILSTILLSELTPYVGKSVRCHQYACQCNRSTTDQIFCIHQILKQKWEYNRTVHQLFLDSETVYASVQREILYNILMESGIPTKLIRLIKTV